MQAIILAGGFGTRLQSVVSNLPKPMAPVGDTPFLEHLLSYWISQGIDSFVLSVHHRWETIREHFGTAFQGRPIQYAIETAPLGTGGAVQYAKSFLDANRPFFIINGDTFLEVDARTMEEFHRQRAADVTIALATVTQNTRYSGLDVDTDGRIHSFQPQGATAHKSINGGVYLVQPNDWGAVEKQSLETQLFPRLIAEGGKFYGFPVSGRFIDIGVPEDYQRAASVLSVT